MKALMRKGINIGVLTFRRGGKGELFLPERWTEQKKIDV